MLILREKIQNVDTSPNETDTKMTSELTLNSLKQRASKRDILTGLRPISKSDKSLIILLDTSGSMRDTMGVETKCDVAWRALKEQLMPNMEGWGYGIIEFGFYTEWTVKYTTDVHRIGTVHRTTPIGGTPMFEALRMAWLWAKNNVERARFILLTDGLPTDAYPEEILSKVVKSIPIDCVGIGSGSGAYDPEFLKQLAEMTGGIFVEADSVKRLTDTILKLSPKERPLLGEVHNE